MKRILILALILIPSISYAGVGGEVLMNAQDTTAPTGVLQANRIKDAATLSGDSITAGIMANGGLVYNSGSATWDRMYGDKTNGIWVNIKSGGITGTITPADAFANPTTATTTFSLTGVFNNTTWDRLRSTSIGNNVAATGILAATGYGQYNSALPTLTTGNYSAVQLDSSGRILVGGSSGSNADAVAVSALGVVTSDGYMYAYNGNTWDRVRTNNLITGQLLVDNSSISASNITTSVTTVVKATGGYVNQMITNTAGTTWTAAFYNVASGGCTGTPVSGYAFTLQANTLGNVATLNHSFTNGICVVTAGTAGNLTVTYR